jgi:serine/threonine protein kinase
MVTRSMATDIVKRGASPPARIGPFQLVRRLGTGGAGQVWLAHKTLGDCAIKVVAMKLTEPNALGYGLYRRMFETEARVAVDLHHTNIVRVFDAIEVEGRGALVMEWVDGTDLARFSRYHRRLTGSTLPDPLISYIVGEILTGLAYAHGLVGERRQVGVIHRDISPHNILLSAMGEVKITDFGIARYDNDAASAGIAGKPSYMAPEQARGLPCTSASDLFSVGAILYELLEGEPLYAGLDGREAFDRAAAGLTPQLRHARDRELSQLCLALLDPDPLARPRSALDALRRLGRRPNWGGARSSLGQLVRTARPASPMPWQSAPEPAPIQAPPSKPRWSARSWALAGALGLACIGATHWSLASIVDASDLASTRAAHELAAGDRLEAARPTRSMQLMLASEHRPEFTRSHRKRAQHKRAKSKPKKTAPESAPTRARVDLIAHEFFYVEVELDDKILSLDPKLSVELEPGPHKLRIRSPHKAWRDIGPLIVEADKHYRVRFKRTGGFALDVSSQEPAQNSGQISTLPPAQVETP